ncbi:hypothetical protein HCG49_16795 [Arenibacter sp. 6A1]|uniref:DUF5712 family protein n=1 Tax=Arenibacter sp. 6A1 TaxID=2720391 RepID=UPI001445CD69|nr:DUF5712 family protein [Arenibacter sp. 6A1]NKI28213.1 hypothetical protein [Arenibacter sp. 6A1]
MIVKVHRQRNTPAANNKGSASNLVSYLEKENNSLENQGFFFGRSADRDTFQENITRTQAVMAIDHNVKGLRKSDTKFFMLTINLSAREQAHIAGKIAGKKVDHISELSVRQRELFEKKLRDFTRGVMGEYAKNFKRGLEEKDLVYVAKIEHQRRYKGYEEAVKSGEKKSGALKEGFQSHVHIVVSRKDRTQRISLSPNAKERIARGGHCLNGKEVVKGFNHETFKLKTEKLFDQQFAYNRKYQESYASKSNSEALQSITRAYKEALTPKEFKEMSALSDANLIMIYKYFTKPSKALLFKISSQIKGQLDLKAKVAQQTIHTL